MGRRGDAGMGRHVSFRRMRVPSPRLPVSPSPRLRVVHLALDHRVGRGQDRSAMFFSRFVTLALLILLAGFSRSASAQGFKQELEIPEKVTVSIKNLEGRVSVVASPEHVKKLTVDARSSGSAKIGRAHV